MSPQDNLISDLVTAELDGEKLDDDEIYSFVRMLLPAGIETTYRSSGYLLFLLLTHPEQLEAVRSDRSLEPQAIEDCPPGDKSRPERSFGPIAQPANRSKPGPATRYAHWWRHAFPQPESLARHVGSVVGDSHNHLPLWPVGGRCPSLHLPPHLQRRPPARASGAWPLSPVSRRSGHQGPELDAVHKKIWTP